MGIDRPSEFLCGFSLVVRHRAFIMLSLISRVATAVNAYLVARPFMTFTPCLGDFVLIVLIGLAFAIGISRKRGFDPRTSVFNLQKYPMISVVMCCKGTHKDSLSNFKRSLEMEYPGEVEFIFVVESESDPALACANEAIRTAHFHDQNRTAKVEIAGLSFHNAQKIHNMMHGVAAANKLSEYVLFVDDDVFLYPGLIEELLSPIMEEPEKIIVSTGYEFILPKNGSSISSYCLMGYRFHNLFSFITNRPTLCWGGCWFAPLWVFRKNYQHLLDCYLDGGYSDDTIISCLMQQAGFKCAHPYRAIFPHSLDEDVTFSKYWEFVVRQFFVLDTYSTPYNRKVDHSLAFLIVSSVWMMGIWMLFSPFIGIVLAILAPTGNIEMTVGNIAQMLSVFLWAILVCGIYWSTKIMTDVSNSVRPENQHEVCKLNPFKIAIGLAIHVFLLPIAVIKAILHDSIVWAGVRYYKQDGKICKVERKGPNNEVISANFSESVSKAIKGQAIRINKDFLKEAEAMSGKEK